MNIYKNDSFSDILKMERFKRAYNQRQMAEFLGLSFPTYFKYEHGGKPTFGKTKKIADKLNIKIEDITYLYVRDYKDNKKKGKK